MTFNDTQYKCSDVSKIKKNYVDLIQIICYY